MNLIKKLVLGSAMLILTACGQEVQPPLTSPPPAEAGVLLTVDRFGQGSITTDAGPLQCADQTCSGSFKVDTTVTLTATPETGWRFDHWTGCDITNGAACSVKTSDPRLVQPYFTTVNEPSVNSQVVVLDAPSLAALRSETNGVLVFDAATPQLKTMRIGQILVSGQGQGFAQRVTNIVALDDGNTFVDTVEADVADLLKDGTIVAQLNNLPSTGQDIWEPAPGVTMQALQPQAAGEDTGTFKISYTGAGVTVEGQVAFEWHPEAAMQFGPRFGDLESAKLVLNPRIQTQLSLKFGPEQSFEPEPKRIFHWQGRPRLVLVAKRIPIMLTPSADVFISVKADASVKVEFKPSYTIDMSAGVAYTQGAGVRPIGHAHGSGDFAINILDGTTVEAEALAELPIEGKIQIYKMLTPKLIFTPYISAAGGFATQPGTACLQFSADIAAKIATGGELVFGTKKLGADFTIFDRKVSNLWEWKSKDCDDTPPTPPGPLQFNERGGDVHISWAASTDDHPGITYAIYRENALIGNTIGTTTVDGSAGPDTYYCFKVFATDKAGNKSTPTTGCYRTTDRPAQPPTAPGGLRAAAKSTTSVALTWIGSGDSQVVGYQIFVNGELHGSVSYTPGTVSVDVQKLTPNTAYCFTVRAYNSYGVPSEHSPKACATTLAPNLTAWTMKIGCQTRDYIIAQGLDLDVDNRSNVSVVGSGNDYNGTRLAYHLHGFFSPTNKMLTAVIDWTFEGSTSVRRDSFTANLSTGDSGNVNMNQELITGCDAKIRFLQGMVPLALPQVTSQSDERLFMR